VQKLGAELGQDLGVHSILLEGDAHAVITVLNLEDEDLRRFESVIVETRDFKRFFFVG
jgi:hypothetical protein